MKHWPLYDYSVLKKREMDQFMRQSSKVPAKLMLQGVRSTEIVSKLLHIYCMETVSATALTKRKP